MTNPSANLAVIAKNGNNTADAVPGGDPGYTVDDAEAYFGQPLTHLFVQFQVNDLTPAQNITNLETIYDAAVALGTSVWICTPHPVKLGAPGINVDDLIALRDLVFATFGSQAIDAWTFNALPNGRDADPALMLDDIHWNSLGHSLFKDIVKATTGLS